MNTGRRGAAALTAALMAVAPMALPATAGAKTAKVRLPAKNAKYTGATAQQGRVVVQVSKDRKHVKLMVFEVACGDTVGTTGVQKLKLKKTKKGYTFGVGTPSTVLYDDDTNEDGIVAVAGRFSKNAKVVSGQLRVKTDRCGDSGAVNWLAAR
jgi:hypothetical protein